MLKFGAMTRRNPSRDPEFERLCEASFDETLRRSVGDYLEREGMSASRFGRTPHGPDRPSRGSGWPCHAPVGASRVASISLLHACPRHYPGGTGRCSRHSLPDRWQPSLYNRRVGFRVTRFEACSAFTRVAAHMLAEPPMVAFTVEVLQTILLPPSSAPTASG